MHVEGPSSNGSGDIHSIVPPVIRPEERPQLPRKGIAHLPPEVLGSEALGWGDEGGVEPPEYRDPDPPEAA